MALLEEIWQTLLQVKLPHAAIDGLGHGVSAQQQRGTRDGEGNISKDLTSKHLRNS